jgi:hypothetical protein
MNNCANNGTPYFLTANHCLGGNETKRLMGIRIQLGKPRL